MEYIKMMTMIDRNINALAEKHGMTYKEFIEWSDREEERTSISQDEYMLIYAYQVDQAILRLQTSADGNKLADNLTREYWWIERFRDDFNAGIDKAIKHLTDVCAYLKKNWDHDYEYEWLLGFDDEFYFKSKEKKGSSKLKWK